MGVNVQPNTLDEIIAIRALRSKRNAEISRDLAIISASIGNKEQAINYAKDYLANALPYTKKLVRDKDESMLESFNRFKEFEITAWTDEHGMLKAYVDAKTSG